MKFGEHGFHFADPDTRNSLPSHLHCLNDAADFKHKLKTNFLDERLTNDWYFCFIFLNFLTIVFIILAFLSDFLEQCYTNFICVVLY